MKRGASNIGTGPIAALMSWEIVPSWNAMSVLMFLESFTIRMESVNARPKAFLGQQRRNSSSVWEKDREQRRDRHVPKGKS
jgi:hypothetical protein